MDLCSHKNAPTCTCRTHNLKCTEMRVCKCEGIPDLWDNFDIDEENDDEENKMCASASDTDDKEE